MCQTLGMDRMTQSQTDTSTDNKGMLKAVSAHTNMFKRTRVVFAYNSDIRQPMFVLFDGHYILQEIFNKKMYN